jgi:hypothetical protein
MDAPFVKEGQPVEVQLSHNPGVKIPGGKVDYIFPWLDRKTRDVKVRLAFDNPDGRLKPEMYASVVIKANLGREALLADSASVIRSGVRNVVFVETEPGTFEPRNVDLGVELDGAVEITAGVREGEAVVVNGQFMLDSESRLKEALQKFDKVEESETVQPPEASHDHSGHAAHAEASVKTVSGDPLEALRALEAQGCTHTCPMPEHFYVCGKGPGKCADCGMVLKPISELKQRFGEKP